MPLAAWVVAERRSAQARAALRLRAPAARSRAAIPAGLAASVGLLALACTQPVLASAHGSTVRRDADVFVVLDTSRSMLAAARPGAPSRFERARAIAGRVARADPTVAVGLASVTDRVLPHLFPTDDRGDFEATLKDSLGIDRPPPGARRFGRELARATNLGVLSDLGTAGFFSPSSTHRVAVVVTDGESRPIDADPIRRAFRRASIAAVFVHVWDAGERVWRPDRSPESAYLPDPASGPLLEDLAAEVGGKAFSETEIDQALAAVKDAVGTGRTERRREQTSVRSLTPFAAAAALIPLAFVVRRRNLA